MRSDRAKIKGFHDDDTNPSSDREESFHNDNEESEDEKKGMSNSPNDDTSSTTANKAKGGDLNVVKSKSAGEVAKGMCKIYCMCLSTYLTFLFVLIISYRTLTSLLLTTLNRRSKHNQHKQQQ